MIKKKLLKPISKKGVVNFQQNNYNFLAPLTKNNNDISLDTSNIALLDRANKFKEDNEFWKRLYIQNGEFKVDKNNNGITRAFLDFENGNLEAKAQIGVWIDLDGFYGQPLLKDIYLNYQSTPDSIITRRHLDEALKNVNVDLSNYYTKQEVENNLGAIDTKTTTNLNNIETNKQDIKEINLKFNDYFNKQEIETKLSTKQDKLTVGAGLNLNGNNLTLTSAPITIEQVKQEIAKAELDDITLNDVENNLIAPINTQIQELQQELNNKTDITVFNEFKNQSINAINNIKNDSIPNLSNKIDTDISNAKEQMRNEWNQEIWNELAPIKSGLDTKQNKLKTNNNIIVNSDNTLSIDPSVFNGYATTQYVNDTFAKTNEPNTFNKVNEFLDDVKILNDKTLKLGYRDNDIKFILQSENNTKDVLISAPQGVIKMSNVATPIKQNDAVNKEYVDNNFINPNGFIEGEVVKINNSVLQLKNNQGVPFSQKVMYYVIGCFSCADDPNDYFGFDNGIKVSKFGTKNMSMSLVGCRNWGGGGRRPVFSYVYNDGRIFLVNVDGTPLEIVGENLNMKVYYKLI